MNNEAVIQVQIVEWLKQTTDLPFYHFAGERKCSPQTGVFLKRMGVKAGVSDLFFPRGNLSAKGLWLELKGEKGRASAAQLTFLKDMRLEGYAAEVSYGYNEAIFYIKSFYDIS